MRKGQITSPEVRLKQSLAHKGKKKNYPVWNKGKKIGNLWPNIGQFQKGQKRSPRAGIKKGYVWSAEQREINRQGQYRRFEREIPNYSYQDDGRRIRRKVNIRKNGGFHSRAEWYNLKAQCNWMCVSCGRAEPQIILTKDHIIAVSRGGSDNIENIQPLCRSCNSKKGTKLKIA